MKPATNEWREKAEGDYVSAQREYRARKDPNFDSACFHAHVGPRLNRDPHRTHGLMRGEWPFHLPTLPFACFLDSSL
jgi:hypothetical protein